MDWIIRGRKELSCSYMEAGAAFLGEDILACIQGGDKPHIGCTVQSVPRPSLTGNGTISATSSVLNLTGHKDLDGLADEIVSGIAGAGYSPLSTGF